MPNLRLTYAGAWYTALVRRPQIFALFAVFLGSFLRFHQLGIVPPGLHYDFAANAIFANQIAFDNWREVFITAYTGKEVLYFYTAGLLFYLIQSSIFVLQYTAAIYGILGIASVYFAARQILHGRRDAAWVAATAAAILAVSFMHLVWSRYGERVTTQVFVQALAVGFLFRGINRANRKDAKDAKNKNKIFAFFAPSRLDFALSGFFTGLAAYTYLSARLFPIPIAFVLIAFSFQQAKLKNLKSLIISHSSFFIFAILVFAPLGYFFLTHPDTFLVRYNQVIVKGDEANLFWQGLTGALGMIFWSGEPYDRFNIPFKPIFDPVLGVFFIIGVLAISIQQSAFSNRKSLTSNLFLFIYTLTFLAPTALSVHDIFPSNVRAMGVMVVLPIFPAIGIVATIRAISHQQSAINNLLSSFVIRHSSFVILLFFSFLTYHSYFNVWATQPSLHYANDTDLVNASRWLNTQDTRDTSIYFSAIHYRHPTVAYLARDYQNIRWYFGANALAIPSGKALYIFPHSEPMIPEWIQNWTPFYAPLGPDGTPDFRVYKFDSSPTLIQFDSASANFANVIELTGMRTAAPNAIDLKWHVLNAPPQPDYRLVADLVDEQGINWIQTYNDSYPSEQWQEGETILMRLKFPDQLGRPNGGYKIRLSFFSPSTKTSLNIITPSGTAPYTVISAPIANLQSAITRLQSPLTTFGNLNLIKVEPPPAFAQAGEQIFVTLHWQANANLANLPLKIKLDDAELELRLIKRLAQNEVLQDRYALRLPRDLKTGVYRLTANDFLLGTINVKEVARQMTAPAVATKVNKEFGGAWELIGFDLKSDSLTLVWRALKEVDQDFVRFVHVLDATGQIVAQDDSTGAYPTSRWRVGEYVTQKILLNTQGTQIEVGWYEAETGARVGEAFKFKP